MVDVQFIGAVWGCHGEDLEAFLRLTDISVLELPLRVVEEFKQKELLACIFFFLMCLPN